MVSLIVLALVFVLIAVRRVGRIRLQIWQVMLAGALVVLVTGQISPEAALRAVDPDVMLFLLGMFVVGQAMDESGYISHLSYRLFHRVRTGSGLLLAVLFVMGLLSALLMNDTIAIIGTPVVLSLARNSGIRPQPLLLALASAVTIGSVASPIGNPQNLLVATHGSVVNPFVTFGEYLLMPTLLCLLLAYGVLRVLYRRELAVPVSACVPAPMKDTGLVRSCRLSLIVLSSMLAIKVGLVLADVQIDMRLTYIALGAALPVLLGGSGRGRIIGRIDWFTLVFFASMFVLMKSVWLSGHLQEAVVAARLDLTSPGTILGVSVVASQFLSNVPLTALYLQLLQGPGASELACMALAAGATVAGLLTILGAASNIIIIQNAERRERVTLTFAEFARAGIPLTALCVSVYWLSLA